jgi:DNA-binding beta-propeller fold protein YncE
LEIDPGGRAYTHLWRGTTLAIDVRGRAITARWPNGCSGSRGIALDAAAGWLFAACAEGRVAVLELANGRVVSSIATGGGVDAIAYDAERRHLYVQSARRATLEILAVSSDGTLSRLGVLQASAGAHGVATDRHGRVFVGDPRGGRLLAVGDAFPAAPR